MIAEHRELKFAAQPDAASSNPAVACFVEFLFPAKTA